MADTFVKIATVTVGAGGASSIDFTSIPSTYTDLCLRISTRSTTAVDLQIMTFNGSSANFTSRQLSGSGSAVFSTNYVYAGRTVDSTYTANTFSSNDIYIPNYAGSTNKSFSIDATNENNATLSYMDLMANLWSNTAAITSISISPNSGNYAQYSTAYLYGISKS